MTILDRILETKRAEVARAKRERPLEQVVKAAHAAPPPRDFLAAVTATSGSGHTAGQGPRELKLAARFITVDCDSPEAAQGDSIRQSYPRLIAEIKQKSPSAGVIRADFDPVAIARVYHQHGAAALSVLTDETYFGGHLDFIKLIKAAVPLPVLRKEFIVEEYQVFESRAACADAVLLIAEAIGADGVAELAPLVHALGMTCLVEVHSMENLEAVLNVLGPPARLPCIAPPLSNASEDTARPTPVRHQPTGPVRRRLPPGEDSAHAKPPLNPNEASSHDPQPIPYLFGINNRDLAVQRTSIETTVRLASLLPPDSAFVAESGISTRADVELVRTAGACAILVGESLLRAPDIGAIITELLSKE